MRMQSSEIHSFKYSDEEKCHRYVFIKISVVLYALKFQLIIAVILYVNL